MKKLTILLIVVLTATASFAQAQVNKNDGAITDNSQNYQAVTYRLFPTQNMWTFIKLNTRNGQMWQVQYSINDNNRFETILNYLPLATKEEETNGRFTLYPTQNIYNFILLDQLNGKTWQVQWSADMEKRVIVAIH